MSNNKSNLRHSFLSFPSFTLANNLPTMHPPPCPSLLYPGEMANSLLGQQYSRTQKVPGESFESRNESSLMNTIYSVFRAANMNRNIKSSSRIPLPSCQSKSDLPPIQAAPNFSCISKLISDAMDKRSTLPYCIDGMTGYSNCMNIMESLDRTMDQSLFCPTNKKFLVKSDFRVDSKEVTVMTPECYKEIINCSAKVDDALGAQTSTEGAKVCTKSTMVGVSSKSQNSQDENDVKNTVVTVELQSDELVDPASCSISASNSLSNQGLLASNSNQCSNKTLSKALLEECDLNELVPPPMDNPDLNNNSEVLQDSCQSVSEWDSDDGDGYATESCNDDDHSSTCSSSDSFLSDGYTSSDDDDGEDLCAWDKILNTRTPYTTHRKKNQTSRRRRFSGDDNLGCKRGSGKADSSYKRFENKESAEILVDPCSLDYDSDDEDDCWFSLEVASSSDTTPIVVRPYCDNSTISSIIGWHDDVASSDDDSSCFGDGDDGESSNIPVYPTASKPSTAADRLQRTKQSKVRFCDTVEVQHMVAWSFAYRQARKGIWEQEARDRERFRHRINNTENNIGWVFSKSHRAEVYHKLQNTSNL